MDIVQEELIKHIAEELSVNDYCLLDLKSGKYFGGGESFDDCFGYLETADEEDLKDWELEMKRDMEFFYTCERVIRIDRMPSNESFEVMENFVEECVPEGSSLRKQLILALEKNRPFARFRVLIKQSDYCQQWYDYRDEKNDEYVRRALTEAIEKMYGEA